MHGSKQEFCLTAQYLASDNGQAQFVFDEPITIKANSKIKVYWANILQDTPQSGYLTRGYTIYVNLPTYTMQNTTNQDTTAFKKSVFLNIPPQNQADQDADDPGALPALISTTYEPFNPRELDMKNQEQQITSLTFQVVDLYTGEPNPTGVGFASRLTIAFCIEECGDEKSMY